MMNEIFSTIKKLRKIDKAPFHTPGHKGKWYGVEDTTELCVTDDLFESEGAIKRAQEDISQIFGGYSMMSVGGSTLAVFSIIYALSRKGKKIIICANSHKSVYHACEIMGVEPVILYGKIEDGIELPVTAKQVEEVLEIQKDVCAVMVVSPDYFGNVYDLKELSLLTKKHKIKLAVDSAHGSHLLFDDCYAGNFADFWINGVHKSLACPTQTSVVCAKTQEDFALIFSGMEIFSTSSPSFPLMGATERGVKHFYFHRELSEKAKKSVARLKKKIEKKSGEVFYKNDDYTKIIFDCKKANVKSEQLVGYLHKMGVFEEFYSERFVCFYASPYSKRRHFALLEKSLLSFKGEKFDCDEYEINRSQVRKYDYLSARKKPFEYVELENASGRIAAENFGLYPPCTPLFTAGEVIEKQKLHSLKTFGGYKGKIRVIKGE